jgi:ribose transport system permease protein
MKDGSMNSTTTSARSLQHISLRYDLIARYGLVLIGLIVLGITTPSGFNSHRILTILGQSAPLGVVSIGQTFVLLVGGIDLSVGSVINMTSIIAAVIMNGQNSNMPLAIITALIAAAAVGLINGLLVAKLRISPMLATLAVSTVIQGCYFVYTGGQPKGNIAPAFAVVANGWSAGNLVPYEFLVWLLICLITAFLLYWTIFGRRLYAVGANSTSAWLSGISSSWYVVIAYVIGALCFSLAGLLLTSYIGVASTGIGDPYTLNSIATAVIGGAAFTGGVGGLAGTFAGTLVMMFLTTILSTLNVPQAAQYVAQGLVIIVMMLINGRVNPARR